MKIITMAIETSNSPNRCLRNNWASMSVGKNMSMTIHCFRFSFLRLMISSQFLSGVLPLPNVPAQRARATDFRHATETQSRT